MTREHLRQFQRQELTMEFANGRTLTAPVAHWVGALLSTLSQADMNLVVDKVVAFRTQPPVQRARLILPPSLRPEQEVANGD